MKVCLVVAAVGIVAQAAPEHSSNTERDRQASIIQRMLDETELRAADILFLCRKLPALSHYDIIRPILEERRDLLLPGTVHRSPPALLAIEEHNTALLRAVLDIACPQEVQRWQCTQLPARAAVQRRNTDALKEILFPARIEPLLADSTYPAHVAHTVVQFSENRAQSDLLHITDNESLFEMALRHTDVTSLALLRQYVIAAYRCASNRRRHQIIHWFNNRNRELENGLITQNRTIGLGALSLCLLVSGIMLIAHYENKMKNRGDAPRIVPVGVTFTILGTLCMIASCCGARSTHAYQRIQRKKQTAIDWYNRLIVELTSS